MSYLACKGLSVGYAGNPVVSGIDFAVNAGDALFVVGENGAGKTTLFRLLLDLLKAMQYLVPWAYRPI